MSIYKWTANTYNAPMSKYHLEISSEIVDIVREVLNGDFEVVRINSLAGTGKTTILYLLSIYYEARCEAEISHQKIYNKPNILYLANSRRLKDEAAIVFSGSPVVYSTMNELALKYMPRYHRAPTYNPYISDYQPEMFIKYFGVDYSIAFEISEILMHWMNSYDMEEGIQSYAYGSSYSTLSANYAHTYITDTRSLEENTVIINKLILKEFQLQLRQRFIFDIKERVDLLLVDEGQDLSDAAIYIFLNFPAKKRVIVGDAQQKIYPYVSTNNALLKEIDNTIEFPLTSSYRHSQEIANAANHVLSMFKGSQQFIIPKQKSKRENIRKEGYLYRWSSGAIEGLLLAIKNNFTRIEIADEIWFLLKMIVSLYYADQEEDIFEESRSFIELIEKHKRRSQVVSYVDYVKNDLPQELFKGNIAQAVIVMQKYNIETIVSMFDSLFGLEKEFSNPEVLITSIHKSKGFEFEKVTILEDMPNLAKVVADYFIQTKQIHNKGGRFNYIKFFGEYIHKKEGIYNASSVSKWVYPINLYYTAITRAREHIVDMSINAGYTSEEAINDTIFSYIRKEKRRISL